MKYMCDSSFLVPDVDDGFYIENTYTEIKAGEIFERDVTDKRMVGSLETIRLENEKTWIEILPEQLKEHFTKIEEGE